MIENKDLALVSKKLVTLKDDVPIENKIESFDIRNIEKNKLYDFLREMEFNRLLSQAIDFYGEPDERSKKKKDIKSKPKKIDITKYTTITKEEELEKLINTLEEKSIISIDTETSSVNPIEAGLVGISVCYSPNVAYYIPLKHKSEKCLDKKLVLRKIKKVFEDPSIKKIGQNIKFDYIILKRQGIDVGPIEDTMLLSYTLNAGINRHNLDTLSEIHLNHKTISFKDLVGSGKNKMIFEEVDLKKATEYAGEDADVTFRLFESLKKRLDQEKLNRIYEFFEKPMVRKRI